MLHRERSKLTSFHLSLFWLSTRFLDYRVCLWLNLLAKLQIFSKECLTSLRQIQAGTLDFLSQKASKHLGQSLVTQI